jgi:signal transduction histidine kinase
MILTQLKKIEVANEITRLKSELLSNMVKDIKISIDNIDSLSELASKEDINDTTKNYFNLILNSTKSLLELTENISNYIKST